MFLWPAEGWKNKSQENRDNNNKKTRKLTWKDKIFSFAMIAYNVDGWNTEPKVDAGRVKAPWLG